MKNPIETLMKKRKVKKTIKKLDKIANKVSKHVKNGKLVIEKKF